MLAEAEALEQAQREERERKLPKEITGLRTAIGGRA
jgi:hypothetical protein